MSRRHRRLRRLLPLLVLLVAAAAHPLSASAHANLVRVVPVPGAVLSHAPTEVRVVFDDTVQPGPGVEAVRNPSGSVLAGHARVVGGKTLVVPLRHGLRNGDYSVRWAIVSDDGHLESGVLAFAVGTVQSPPVAALAAEATGPGPVSVVERWLLLVGVLGAGGISLFSLLVVRDLEGAAAGRVKLILGASALLAAVGAAGELGRVGFATRDGAALAAGLAAALVVAMLSLAAAFERRALRPALVLALGLLAVPSVAGHALDPGLARLNVAADVLHVAAASAWAGMLVALVVLPVGKTELRRSIWLAAAAVVVLGATGIVRASYELLSASQLWGSSYGRTLLVKTAILVVAVVAGFSVRRWPRRQAATELAFIAGLLVAVAVLVQLRPGRNIISAPAAPTPVAASESSADPPPPPPGAVVLAREAGPLGVALAAEPRRLTVTVLAPGGGGLDRLGIRFLPTGTEAEACGSGCYTAAVAPSRRVGLEIRGFGPTRRVGFTMPTAASPADGLVRRIRARYRSLRAVTFLERLASDPRHAISSRWRLESPDRLSYAIVGGAQAIVIGTHRWDRNTPTGRWVRSPQLPRLPQPATTWTSERDAHIIARSASALTVSWADPTIPAFYELTLDPHTMRPRLLHMISNAHFMTDRYVGFSPRREIHAPPRRP